WALTNIRCFTWNVAAFEAERSTWRGAHLGPIAPSAACVLPARIERCDPSGHCALEAALAVSALQRTVVPWIVVSRASTHRPRQYELTQKDVGRPGLGVLPMVVSRETTPLPNSGRPPRRAGSAPGTTRACRCFT